MDITREIYFAKKVSSSEQREQTVIILAKFQMILIYSLEKELYLETFSGRVSSELKFRRIYIRCGVNKIIQYVIIIFLPKNKIV